jgi:hypothetical protein
MSTQADSLISVISHAQEMAEAGQIQDAIAEYRVWLDTADERLAYAALFNLAVLYLQTGLIGLGQAALRRCLVNNPTFEPALKACYDTYLDAHHPMAARAAYGHSKLRVGWLGEGTELRGRLPHVWLDASEQDRHCEHYFFSWGDRLVEHAVDLTALTNEQAACLIRRREIDVLVDIHGWAGNYRPGILAYHPASLQITWPRIAQPSGLAAIDIVLLTGSEHPTAQPSDFSEKRVSFKFEYEVDLNQSISENDGLTQLEKLLVHEHSVLNPRRLAFVSPQESLAYLQAPESKGSRYVIVAPPYEHNSAGIRVLYELQKWLVRAGYDAVVCTWFQGYPVGGFSDDIVIYPEVAPGNLLQARKVVRYIMNTPGKLGHGEKTYAANELLVAYNQDLAPFADGLVLQVPSTEAFFHSCGVTRYRDAVYVGKGRDLGRHPSNCVEITKYFPKTRPALADLLRTVNTLYSYDDFTMLAYEAQLCGCKVVLINPLGEVKPVDDVDIPEIDKFKMQLHQFIEITQRI